MIHRRSRRFQRPLRPFPKIKEEEKEVKENITVCEFWDEEKQKCKKRDNFKDQLGKEKGKYKWFSCDYGSGIRKDILNFKCAIFIQKIGDD